jgi:hypothetical protein
MIAHEAGKAGLLGMLLHNSAVRVKISHPELCDI